MSIDPAALRVHLLEELLPLWSEHGIDRERGGFHPKLTPELAPGPDTFKRLVTTARQIYAFSHAALLGADGWALDAARHGMAFMTERFWDSRHGGWYLTTDLAGQPQDRRKDSYAHASVLFAMAYYHRATREPEALEFASRTLDVLEQHLSDAGHGGFLEGATESWEPRVEPRRQNPHMHLLEGFLALHGVTREARYLEHAERIIALFEEAFQDTESGSLGEFFSDDWGRHPGPLGQVLEPGHHFEWVWLLHRFAETSGRDSILEPADRLFRFALEHGVDRELGGVYDEINRDGLVVRDTKRLWPQTEFIKALVARHETQGGGEAPESLERALEYCFTRYVDPQHRGWNDHLTREGEVFSDLMPATSLYHITLALAEVIRVFAQ